MDMGTIQAIYEKLDIPVILLGLGNLVFFLILAKWHVGNDTRFDFRSALLDPETGAISFTRLGQLTALVVSSELLIYEAVKGTLTEWFVMGYLTAWAGLAGWNKWQDKQIAVSKSEADPRP